MKKITVLFFVLFSMHTAFAQVLPVVQEILNSVNQDSVVYFVRELSGDVSTVINGAPYTILSRNKYQPGNDMATQYIKQKLESYGLTTTFQPFGTGGTGKNIYGVKTGTTFPNKKYIICAHMDDMPSGTLAPGADDNASGTAAVIEAARILKNYESPYTLIYALWDEEEQGLVGSAYYALQAYNAGDSIMGVVNMDMIAFDSNNDNKCEVHTRSVGTSLNLSAKMVQCNTDYGLGMTIVIKNPGSTYSDHASFWNRNFGAILLIEDNNDFHVAYHTVNDNMSYYNYPYFVKMTKLALATFSSLIQVQAVPVELASFGAEVLADGVSLKWATSSETNNRGFEIERSIDGINWASIGFVNGKGTSTEMNYYSFTDRFYGNGVYYYRLVQMDFDGTEKAYDAVQVDLNFIATYSLGQNYPNPFNPVTTINYSVPQTSHIRLAVYNLLGEQVALLVNESKETGTYQASFDASNLNSGVYIYRMESNNFMDVKKLVVMK